MNNTYKSNNMSENIRNNTLEKQFKAHKFTINDVITEKKMTEQDIKLAIERYKDNNINIKEPSPTDKEIFMYSIINNKVDKINKDELKLKKRENDELVNIN